VPDNVLLLTGSQNKSAGQQQITMTKVATASKTNGQSNAPKMEVKKNETSTVENPNLSLEKSIQKVQELNIVIEKW